MVAFYVKSVKGKAVFYAAVLAEIIVCILGFNDVVAYLWLNVIGCLLVVFFALVIQQFLNKKAAPTNVETA